VVEILLTEQEVWKRLETIKDPEIPALSIVDLKIIRNVHVEDGSATVDITPTFVGCPALEMIAGMIHENLISMGFKDVLVNKSYAAHWSTDMLDEGARKKLEAFVIAPPAPSSEVRIELPTLCPYCKSSDTKLESAFGATLCKQLYYCNACRQSFEKFRAV
jgi:ring-1,2-phenylacetyl-CoA epoxidase subunit PaaD